MKPLGVGGKISYMKKHHTKKITIDELKVLMEESISTAVRKAFYDIIASHFPLQEPDRSLHDINPIEKKINFTDLFLLLKQGDPAGPYPSLEAAQQAGAVTINYGLLANAIITFLIVAVALFLVIKGINRLNRGSGKRK